MKNTRENVIKLLKQKIEHIFRIAEVLERLGDIEGRKMSIKEAADIQSVLWLLEDNEFFNKQWKILNKESK